MIGDMQKWTPNIAGIIEHAKKIHPKSEIISKLTNFLNSYTNNDWDLIHLENKDAKTLLELKKENEINLSNSINENNIVQEIMKNFPGSKISKSSLN